MYSVHQSLLGVYMKKNVISPDVERKVFALDKQRAVMTSEKHGGKQFVPR